MIDAGKRAESGQAGHRPSKRRGLSAAVPVPTIDGGKLTAGKLAIVPRSSTWQRIAVPVVSMIDGGKLTAGNSARRSST